MRSISIRIDSNSVKWAWSRDHVTSWNLIMDYMSEMVQDRDILTMEDN